MTNPTRWEKVILLTIIIQIFQPIHCCSSTGLKPSPDAPKRAYSPWSSSKNNSSSNNKVKNHKRDADSLPLELLFPNLSESELANLSASNSTTHYDKSNESIVTETNGSIENGQYKDNIFDKTNTIVTNGSMGKIMPDTTSIIDRSLRDTSETSEHDRNKRKSATSPSRNSENDLNEGKKRKQFVVTLDNSTSQDDQLNISRIGVEEKIRNALIEHTLKHGGEDDLDQLVFSSIPEGSRLIVSSVKVIRTDQDGHPIEDDDENSMFWDVVIANATDPELDDEEEFLARDTRHNAETNDYDDKNSRDDLRISGSQHRENYKAYGGKEKTKEKQDTHWRGSDKKKHADKKFTG